MFLFKFGSVLVQSKRHICTSLQVDHPHLDFMVPLFGSEKSIGDFLCAHLVEYDSTILSFLYMQYSLKLKVTHSAQT